MIGRALDRFFDFMNGREEPPQPEPDTIEHSDRWAEQCRRVNELASRHDIPPSTGAKSG